MPLEIALRTPAFSKYVSCRPGEKDLELIPIEKNGNETIFELPPLPAWQSMMIAGK